MATIPLRFMHDLFTKLPLIRGAYITMTISTNTQCNVVMTMAGSVFTAVNVSSQHPTIPFMVSPISTAGGDGLRLPAATLTVNASLAIGKSYDGTINSVFYSSCRFYGSMVQLEATHEEMYLMKMPSKVIKYNDILQFQTLGVASNGQFSQVLTNSVARIRYLLGVPIIDSATNGGLNPMQSPFTSCPATTASYAYVNNFNVLLSGVQWYQQNINYGYDAYMEEIRPSLSINGGLSVGLNSGLISRNQWDAGYRYIYVDLSRKVSPAEDSMGRSVQVIGGNNSLKTMSYYWIIGYEREINIATATGNLII
jgi:hypothetical protein